jgi:hypothetical protein
MSIKRNMSFHEKRIALIFVRTLGCQLAVITIFLIVCAIVFVFWDLFKWLWLVLS